MLGSPKTRRKTQVSTSVLKLNKQVSDSVLDAPPPRDVKTVLKEQAGMPKMEVILSPKVERAMQTTVPPTLEEAHEVIHPPKVEPPHQAPQNHAT